MKQSLLVFVLFLSIAAAVGSAMAGDNARDFVAAMAAYKAENYPAAIEKMETIARNGIENGRLYYNLGNAHLKNNDLGRAILWYERAAKWIPNDPNLRFNYDYARSLTLDASEDEETPLVRIFFFWKYRISQNSIIILSLIFNTLFWCLATAGRLTRRRGFRIASRIVLVPSVVFILTAASNYYGAAHRSCGIVLPEKVSVRSGLEKTSTELFVLHAGAKVNIVREMNGHHQIRYTKEKIGWLPARAIGRI
jgi:tetratricopeptide (TPR) repeat protein